MKASNQAWRPTFRPVVVVAGGTNGKHCYNLNSILGIGAGIAMAMAKYSPQDANAPHIILIGRNRQSVDAVIESMTKANSAGKYEFVQGDLTLMKNVKSVVAEIAKRVECVNFLCMSPGIATFAVNDDTEEGIDRKLALHFYARLFASPRNILIMKFSSCKSFNATAPKSSRKRPERPSFNRVVGRKRRIN